MDLFRNGALGTRMRWATQVAGLEPDRWPGVIRSLVMIYVGYVYSTGTSNFLRFPKYYQPFINLHISEPMLASMCLAFGLVGVLGGIMAGLSGFSARMVAAVWSAAFWTTAALGLWQGAGTEIVATAAYFYIAVMSWRHLAVGGRS